MSPRPPTAVAARLPACPPACLPACLGCRSSFRHIQGVCGEVLGQLKSLGPDEGQCGAGGRGRASRLQGWWRGLSSRPFQYMSTFPQVPTALHPPPLPPAVFDVDGLLMRATVDVIGRVGFDCDFRTVQVSTAGCMPTAVSSCSLLSVWPVCATASPAPCSSHCPVCLLTANLHPPGPARPCTCACLCRRASAAPRQQEASRAERATLSSRMCLRCSTNAQR
jgi:hypothetical protein